MLGYEAIKTQTLTTTAATVEFANVPQNFKDLVLVCNSLANASMSIDLRFNNDGTNTCSYIPFDTNGSSPSSPRQNNVNSMQVNAWSVNVVSNVKPSPAICHINDYANTNTHKTMLVQSTSWGASTDVCTTIFVGTWRDTSAITNVKVNGNWAANSSFTLYGIRGI